MTETNVNVKVNEDSSIQRVNTRETKCSNCCETAKAVGVLAIILLTSVGVLASIFFFSSNKFTDILKNLALRITGKNISDALASRIRMISTFVIPFLILVLGGGAFGVLFASSRCGKRKEEGEIESNLVLETGNSGRRGDIAEEREGVVEKDVMSLENLVKSESTEEVKNEELINDEEKVEVFYSIGEVDSESVDVENVDIDLCKEIVLEVLNNYNRVSSENGFKSKVDRLKLQLEKLELKGKAALLKEVLETIQVRQKDGETLPPKIYAITYLIGIFSRRERLDYVKVLQKLMNEGLIVNNEGNYNFLPNITWPDLISFMGIAVSDDTFI